MTSATDVATIAETPQGPRGPITAEEFGPVDVPLSEILVDGRLDINESVLKYFTFEWRPKGLRLGVRNVVGLIPLNARTSVNVVPRVGLSNFGHMLSVAEGYPTPLELLSRGYAAANQRPKSLVEAFARGFLIALRELERDGVHHDYRLRRETTSFPRGRILLGATLERLQARSINHMVVAAWHERTKDSGANRLLKYVTVLLAQLLSSDPTPEARQVRAALGRVAHLFAGVELDIQRKFMRDRAVIEPESLPAIFAHYRRAIHLARAIVQHVGLEPLKTDQLHLESLIFHADKIFEGYVLRTLQKALSTGQSGLIVLDGNSRPGSQRFFDSPQSKYITPDIVVRRGTELTSPIALVGDVKYIIRRPDVQEEFQVVSYAASYRTNEVLLIQPVSEKQKAAGLYAMNTIGNLHLHYYAMNLGASDLQLEEQQLIAAVYSLLSSNHTARRRD